MKLKDLAWTFVGLAAVAFSVWLLYHELRSISVDDVLAGLAAITPHQWLLAVLSTLLAYAALAGYDRLALHHLGRKLPFAFIALASFTTYALAHNIGASVMSGAVVRYRAYRSKGLDRGEVAVLIGFCSFTFALGVVLLGGLVLLARPHLAGVFFDWISPNASRAAGILMLGFVALYVFGSWRNLAPLRLGKFHVAYPRLPIALRQLVIGPLELIGAAGIIYFALPEAGNPGFVAVLGIFLASFSVALLSHAPGGLGVLEVVFLLGMPQANPADVMAALLVFRLLYLIVPFALSLIVVVGFERAKFIEARRRPPGMAARGGDGGGD
ncbi:YbhN family protein [Aurantimonas sp. Leaf443]|uniref:lysylphosphatidylglycerol synthase transmembrane domain-containing protein n=1 Tax=Aurantimonas sp. Leaf443 TaxID=1736378 RepID=UPI0006F1D9E7|nr:YbhN family protein [Aurantimonas sp. Leaf443]KQT85206.1 hypothetical protein ASG48_08045 [Aurantimonas sp. Leaf443]